MAVNNDYVLPYLLDDLGLECVKEHLSALEAVFFSPISDRFGSIRVLPERRISLAVDGLLSGRYFVPTYRLSVRSKNGTIMAVYRRMSRRTLYQMLMTILATFSKFHLIAVSTCTLEHWNALLRDLWWAAMGMEKGPIDVRRFELKRRFDDSFNNNILTKWIQLISPSIRHLKMECATWGYQFDYPGEEDVAFGQELLLAIRKCHHLRSMDLPIKLSREYSPSPFAGAGMTGIFDLLGSLPRLKAFSSNDYINSITGPESDSSFPLPKRSLTLSHRWLPYLNGGLRSAGWIWFRDLDNGVDLANLNNQVIFPAYLQSFKTFLGRLNVFTLFKRITGIALGCPSEGWCPQTVDFFIQSMSQPLPMIIISDHGYWKNDPVALPWPTLLDTWLHEARFRRAIIVFASTHPPPTQAELTDIEAWIANNGNPLIDGFISPDYNPEGQRFQFRNGGEMRLQLLVEN